MNLNYECGIFGSLYFELEQGLFNCIPLLIVKLTKICWHRSWFWFHMALNSLASLLSQLGLHGWNMHKKWNLSHDSVSHPELPNNCKSEISVHHIYKSLANIVSQVLEQQIRLWINGTCFWKIWIRYGRTDQRIYFLKKLNISDFGRMDLILKETAHILEEWIWIWKNGSDFGTTNMFLEEWISFWKNGSVFGRTDQTLWMNGFFFGWNMFIIWYFHNCKL